MDEGYNEIVSQRPAWNSFENFSQKIKHPSTPTILKVICIAVIIGSASLFTTKAITCAVILIAVSAIALVAKKRFETRNNSIQPVVIKENTQSIFLSNIISNASQFDFNKAIIYFKNSAGMTVNFYSKEENRKDFKTFLTELFKDINGRLYVVLKDTNNRLILFNCYSDSTYSTYISKEQLKSFLMPVVGEENLSSLNHLGL